MLKWSKWAVLVVVLAVAAPVWAQDAVDAPSPESAPAAADAPAGDDVEPVGKGDDPVDPMVDEEEIAAKALGAKRDAAQADVNEARKLARVQRYDEAIKLLQDAYLVLEDPELLRMLGDMHADKGELDAAVRFYDDYLADAKVGEMSKKPVRQKRAEVLKEAGRGDEVKDDDEGGGDGLGLTGWQSGGASLAEAGSTYLRLGARYTHHPSSEFTRRRGGAGDDADQNVNDQWIHGGVGAEVGFGYHFSPELALGGTLGFDVMKWESFKAQEAFQTTYIDGFRPELSVDLRYFVSWGFHFGVVAGVDAMIFSGAPDCSEPGTCPEGLDASDGLASVRLLGGLLVGYRAELTEKTSMGLDVAVKQVPVFLATGAGIDTLPGYTDSAWLINLAIVVNWNL